MLFRSGNGSGNANDIARTKSGGQSGCKGTEGGKVFGGARCTLPVRGNGKAQGPSDMPLWNVEF